VMEYVKAGRIDDELARFDPHAEHDRGFAKVEALLEVIGQMLIGDLLIYNADRFSVPGVWDHPGNYGNMLTTSSLKAVSIDHEVFSNVPAQTHAINLPKVEQLLERLARAELFGAGATGTPLGGSIARIIQSICGDRFAGGAPYVVYGAMKGIALVANYPRPWYSTEAEPGLFEYLDQWEREWAAMNPTLPFVDDAGFGALKQRVRSLHAKYYPMLLANPNADVQTILRDVFSRAVPLPEGMEKHALRPIRRNPVVGGRWAAVGAMVHMETLRRKTSLDDDASSPSSSPASPASGRRNVSFIESPCTTKAEYETWRQQA